MHHQCTPKYIYILSKYDIQHLTGFSGPLFVGSCEDVVVLIDNTKNEKEASIMFSESITQYPHSAWIRRTYIRNAGAYQESR